MKTQTLYKRLSLPLLVTVVSATGIGVSSPARSASLLGSQNTVINANPEATLIADKSCRPEDPCQHPGANSEAAPELSPTENPSKEPRYQRPRPQQRQQQQRELEQQREQQQRELEQQQRQLQQQREQQQRELEQQSHHPRINSQRSLA